jgi:hypothetical protein
VLDPNLLTLLISFFSPELQLDFFVLEILVHPFQDLLAALHVAGYGLLVHDHSNLGFRQVV